MFNGEICNRNRFMRLACFLRMFGAAPSMIIVNIADVAQADGNRSISRMRFRSFGEK